MVKWSSVIIIWAAIVSSGTTASLPEGNIFSRKGAQTQEKERTITIDFKVCAPERKTISFSHGSTVYELKKEGRNSCRLNYGTEIENPEWDQFLDVTCLIPRRVGRQNFSITSRGVDFSSLKTRCKSVPRQGE